MGEDIALRRTARGRFTFHWRNGNPVFDERGAYPVFSTLFLPKGSYRWDASGTQGTELATLKQDRLATTSQMQSYALDALQQAARNGRIDSAGYSAKATRLQSGRYDLELRWSAQGTSVSERVRV